MASKNELKLQKQIDEIKSDISVILELIERVRNENCEDSEKQNKKNDSTKGQHAVANAPKRRKGMEQSKTNEKASVND